MHKWVLFISFCIGFSCDSKEKSNPELELVKPIDELVDSFEKKLSKVVPKETQPFDSTIIRENYSIITCYKSIDSVVNKIGLGVQGLIFRSTEFYFIKGAFVLAKFYREQNYNLVQSGSQYFQNDSLIYTISHDSLPEHVRTLRQADSVKSVCAKMLKPQSLR